jgi:serine/threonine protein kinase
MLCADRIAAQDSAAPADESPRRLQVSVFSQTSDESGTMTQDNPTKVEQNEAIQEVELSFDPEELIGHSLAGRYKIEERIGKGGMGVVYLASQSALNRKVVVKVLASGLDKDEEAITRFEREALGLSQLQHPNIVTIYDFGRDRGLAYIVMEYVEGVTLSQVLRRKGHFSFDEFAQIAAQTIDALAEAHARGIIHRDIKPSNIMLCERHGQSNYVKVLDFGLAKLVGDSAEVTKKQNLVGSVAFLAPEQILGLAFDQRVDVYAMGVLFYYMLSGQKPFRGDDDMAVLYQHIHKNPTPLDQMLPDPQSVPMEVIALIHRCLDKDPNNRPQDARELLTQLQTDVSRSVFAMPWASGEFAALPSSMRGSGPTSRPGSGSYPSLPRHNQVTPHSGNITPHSGVFALPGQHGDMSGQFSQQSIHTPYPVQAAPNNRTRHIVIGLVAALVLAVAIGLVLKNNGSAARQERLSSALAQVEQLVDKQEWGQAQIILDSLQQDLAAEPVLLAQAAEQQKEINVGRFMVQAETAEKAGDMAGARAAYQKVLEHDPKHADAQARLAQIAAAADKKPASPKDAAQLGTIKVDARVKARVVIDGDFVGYTPVTAQLPPGPHAIEVSAKGFAVWTHELELAKGQTETLDAALEAEKADSPKYTWRPKKGSGKKADDKPSENDDKKSNGTLLPLDKPKPIGDLLPVQ